MVTVKNKLNIEFTLDNREENNSSLTIVEENQCFDLKFTVLDKDQFIKIPKGQREDFIELFKQAIITLE